MFLEAWIMVTANVQISYEGLNSILKGMFETRSYKTRKQS